MIRKALLVFIATTLPPVSLHAQEPDEAAAAAFQRASEAGIPVSLLESKLAEGRAKGVPMDVIQEALQRRVDALIRASAALREAGIGDPDVADLSVGADALQGGVSEAVLITIAETAPMERRTVAIAALTQLVGVGIVPEKALLRVEQALQRGPNALANLPVQAGVAPGAGPGAVPGAVAGGVGAPSGVGGIPDGVPASGRPADAGPPNGRPGG